MTMTSKQDQMAALIRQATVIPVLTIEKLEHAVPLAKALVAGGVKTLEVTLRTSAMIAFAASRRSASSLASARVRRRSF